MALFRTEHRRLLEMFHPAQHGEFAELLSALGKFMDARIVPLSPDFDTKKAEIRLVRRELLENGICQISYPKAYGGLGLPFSLYIMAIELAGAADASIAMSVAIHNTVADGLLNFGSEEQKQRYLPDLISGRKLGAFSLTEPGSGSDSKSLRTRATRSRNDYTLNGSKMFITNAEEADVYLVFAATDAGPSCFLIDKGTRGLSFGEDLPKLGMRGSRTSEVRFDDCRVPSENLVGDDGAGFEYAKAMLNGSRIAMGALCMGIAQVAFEKALRYSKQRKAFGQSISDFQLIREKIADMRTGINAGRLMCFYASRLKELGSDYSSESAQAKILSTEMSLDVCDAAIQIFGGYGYTSGDLHRHWRDARLLTIGEGTSEILRMLIAGRELAKAL